MSSDGRAVYRDSQGVWLPDRNWPTSFEVRRKIPFSAQRFAEWKAILHSFRPTQSTFFGADKKGSCAVAYYDMPSRRIEWADGAMTTYLSLDLGCDPEEHRELLQLFETLPMRLGLKGVPRTDDWVAATPQS